MAPGSRNLEPLHTRGRQSKGRNGPALTGGKTKRKGRGNTLKGVLRKQGPLRKWAWRGPHTTPLISDLAAEVEYIVADGPAQVAAAGVDVGDGLGPGVRVGEGHVEDVALADVAREEEGGEDGEVRARELEVCGVVMLVSDAAVARGSGGSP